MTERTENEQPQTPSPGDRRDQRRRANERRAGDRRFPLPVWRRPWALVGAGVVGALLLIGLFSLFGEDEEQEGELELTTATAPPAVDPRATPAAAAPPRDAYSVGDFERLLAEGTRVSGLRVRTLLYCQPTSVVALTDNQQVSESVAMLADDQRRVPAAQCTWSAEEGAPDFLLLVPAGLAERFAATPEVEQGFVRRRRVPAEIEWLGRADALALRTAGVLRAVHSE